MKKSGAVAILVTMLTGLLAWGGTNIIANGKNVVRLEAEGISTMRLLLRIEKKVDRILMRE